MEKEVRSHPELEKNVFRLGQQSMALCQSLLSLHETERFRGLFVLADMYFRAGKGLPDRLL